jgi:hypothetical protein
MMALLSRKWFWLTALSMAVVAGFVALGLREQSHENRQLRQAWRQAQAHGIPLDATSFRKWRGFPAPDRNARPLYERAVRQYWPTYPERLREPGRTSMSAVSTMLFRWRRGSDPLDELEHAETMLAALGETYRLTLQASELPAYALEEEATFKRAAAMPDQMELLQLTRMLTLDAIVGILREDFDRSERSLRAAARLAGHLWQAPTMSSFSVGTVVCSEILRTVKWMLASNRWPAARLGRMQALLEPCFAVPDMGRLFRSYVFQGLLALEAADSLESMRAAGFDDRLIRRSPPKPGMKEETLRNWLALANETLAQWPENPEDLDAVEEAMGERVREMESVLSLYNAAYRRNSPDEPSSMEQVLRMVRDHQARARVVNVLVAMLLVQTQNGSLPDVPPVPASELRDPWSDEALRFRRYRGGFIVYSIAVDREDDGGSTVRRDRRPADWVVRYPDSRMDW